MGGRLVCANSVTWNNLPNVTVFQFPYLKHGDRSTPFLMGVMKKTCVHKHTMHPGQLVGASSRAPKDGRFDSGQGTYSDSGSVPVGAHMGGNR